MCKKKGSFQGQLMKNIKGVKQKISGPDNSKNGRMIVLDFVSKGEVCLGEIDSDLLTCLFPEDEYNEVLAHLKSGKAVNIMGQKSGTTLDPAYWEVEA